jgi:hypothetical protein
MSIDPGQAVAGAGLYADGYSGRARMVVEEDHGTCSGLPSWAPAWRS